MNRLIVVSNRVASPAKNGCPGGLASGLLDALRQIGGLWFGWNGEIKDDAGELSIQEEGEITFVTTSLTRQQFQQYYCGFANSMLWPVFHYRTDIANYNSNDYAGYCQVNTLLAQKLIPLLRPDDLLWVQDYHLIPFANSCRQLGVRNRIGFFLHTPFPCAEIARTIPPHHDLFGYLADYDLVGFQTETDHQAFLDYARRFNVNQGVPPTGVYPIGIAPDAVTKMAEDHQQNAILKGHSHQTPETQVIFGVDRLDYSKGLPERFQGYERFLETYPDYRRQVQFVQMAGTTREDLTCYRRIHQQLNAEVGRINGRFGAVDWLPLNYLNQSCSRACLAGLMRQARVGLVTPLRDGMNLVAKEYVAAQDADNPGVLILSCFAGAAHELDAALMVNPHDADEVAMALDRALTMSLSERKARHRAMMQVLNKNTIADWHGTFLTDLRKVRPTNTLLRERLGAFAGDAAHL
ncbi:trehalose-6-phosphate synthase [Pectobacterium actinidiae]|uniref:Trehalose-6-phosphate synthase n=1 Tax=Pectobacterium actinidiae TaxID=1507808 RepID=A0ABW8GFD4_9GAMM